MSPFSGNQLINKFKKTRSNKLAKNHESWTSLSSDSGSTLILKYEFNRKKMPFKYKPKEGSRHKKPIENAVRETKADMG